MNCNNFKDLEGCGKCTCYLTDYRYLYLLTPLSTIDIIDKIILECNSFPTSKIVLNESTITCTGDINIVYVEDSFFGNSSHSKHICYQFINQWIEHNILTVYDALNIVYLILCASILNYNEREQKALNMLDSMNILFNYIHFYIRQLNKQ